MASKNKVKKFSSYKNNYNNTFINLLNYTYPNEFEINYVEKIEDSKEKVFIIPPTSSKSLLMECDAYAIKNGDFRSDATMLKLFDNKKIEKIARLRLKLLELVIFFVMKVKLQATGSLV